MTQTFHICQHIDMQPMDTRLLILDVQGNAYYSLNGSARFFIEKIAAGLAFDAILNEALNHFSDVSPEMLSSDYQKLTEELCRLGIIAPN